MEDDGIILDTFLHALYFLARRARFRLVYINHDNNEFSEIVDDKFQLIFITKTNFITTYSIFPSQMY